MQLFLIEANHHLFAPTCDRTPQQIWFGQNRPVEFLRSGELSRPAALFVGRVTYIEKRRDVICGKDKSEFRRRQRLTRVIAFVEFQIGVLRQFAQETPGVATSGSGAFEPEGNYIHNDFSAVAASSTRLLSSSV